MTQKKKLDTLALLGRELSFNALFLYCFDLLFELYGCVDDIDCFVLLGGL